jgi:homoserine kinase type II
MGIKVEIEKYDLPIKYQKYSLKPTVNGVMATVYLLDDIYVLKVFDKDTNLKAIESEIELLNSISSLPIPKVIDRFQIKGLEATIYTQIQGDIVPNPNQYQIRELGAFLREFHNQTKYIKSKNMELFTKERLKELIGLTKDRRLLKEFNLIDITLKRDGVIHGDIFMDNCKFKGENLSGVFDFSDACLGDFYFDLAIITISSCFNSSLLDEKKVEALLSGYGANIKIESFYKYIRYALLYYATNRFLSNRDYNELLNLLENLE